MFVIWIGIFLLGCPSVSSIGYVQPEKAVRRTLIDITKTVIPEIEPEREESSNKRTNQINTTNPDPEIQKLFTSKDKNKTQNNFKQSSLLDNANAVDSESSGSGLIETVNEEDTKDTKNVLKISKPQTEKAKKKQYATDDFRVNSMSQQPTMSLDAPPPMMAPGLNHVTIDNFDEGIHLPMEEAPHMEPHHEEPHHEVILPHYEEPTYVHHVEPPPPPPPEHVMIPVPIAAPPPPPPPPPPCTVHIPVTIHLKGKLAIKMRHCENCDFSKNIEAIGPLKIAPINGLKDKLTGAVEAQAKKSLFESATTPVKDTQPEKPKSVYSDIQGTRRDAPPTIDMTQAMQYSTSDDINFDNDFFDTKLSPDEMRGTKKDITDATGEKRHVVVAQPVMIPDSLVPSAAFKKGVVISLPRGKALLKCVAPVNGTGSESAGSKLPENSVSEISQQTSPTQTVQPVPPLASATSATLSADNNDVVTLSDPKQRVIRPLSSLAQPELIESDSKQAHVRKLLQPESKSSSDKKDSNESPQSNTQKGHSPHKLTEKFLRMFDKDMLVALYKMAVKDILNELQHQKKAHKKTQIIRKQMKKLEMERSKLEKQFAGISTSLSEPPEMLRELRSIDDIDDAGDDDIPSVTFPNTHGAAIKVSPEKLHTSNSTRRVKLVDTYRTVAETVKQTKPSNLSKQTKPINAKVKVKTLQYKNSTKVNIQESTPEEASSALSFYGDLDPTKLMEDQPTCIDAMCEKHKQFIKHAGQYFESLDSIALEPYQKFMTEKDMTTSATMNADTSVYDTPYNDAVNIEGMKRNGVVNNTNVKRQTISDTMDSSNVIGSDEPSTIVELFGKLPRVPLKITLNPKGPLSKMKKPIEISLRPPGKGESSSKMIATANDPAVAVHIANKIFKEEPLDAKQEQKLQDVYRDIKRSTLSDEKGIRHVYLQPQKLITEKASRKMRILVSLPKELTKLMVQNNYQSTSRSLGLDPPPQEKQPVSSTSTSLLMSKPTYVVGQENEDKLMGSEKSKLRPEIEEYEQKLKKLKEQTNAVMAQYNKLKDPYSDIGKKRRFKSKSSKSSKKHVKAKIDPYADLGANVATLEKRSDMELRQSNDISSEEASKSQSNETTSEKSSELQNATQNATSEQSRNEANEKGLVPEEVEKSNNTTPEEVVQSHSETTHQEGTTPIKEIKQSHGKNMPDEDVQSKTPPEEAVKSHGNVSPEEAVQSDGKTPPEEVVQSQSKAAPEETVQSHNNDNENRLNKLSEDLGKLQEDIAENLSPTKTATGNEGKDKNKVTAGSPGKPSGNMTAYEEISKDPYATMGSSISSVDKRGKLPKMRKKLDKRHRKVHLRKGNVNEINSEKRNLPLQGNANLPTQVGISLVRHTSNDISKEVTVEPSASVKGDNLVNDTKNQVKDNPQVKIDTEKPLPDTEKTSMLTAFPKFSEALSKISPETRKKLLNLKPFKFLSNVDASNIPYKQTGKDPYADMGSEATSSKRKTVAKTLTKHSSISKSKKTNRSASKRSETYDPYADLGTSIGLSQNEARSKTNETQTVHVSLTKPDDKIKDTDSQGVKIEDGSLKDDDQPKIKKVAKVASAATRTQSEEDKALAFINAATSHINAMDTVDPYADLGASANRDPQPYNSSKSKTVQQTNFTERQEKVTNPTNRTVTPQDHKYKKVVDNNVEHFIGKLKLPEKTTEVSNEMEAGDLNQPNEMAEHIASLEKAVAGENDLATIERLESDINAEKVKAEASQFPHPILDKYSMLQQNVGKEIQGPYTDIGTKKKKIFSSKKVTIDVNPSVRQLDESMSYGASARQLKHKLRYSSLRKTIRLEKALRKHNEEAIRHMIEKHVEHIASRFITAAEKKRMIGKKCSPMKADDVKKLLMHVAEKAENKSIDPYHFIGTEIAKKYRVNPCNPPVIKEEEDLPMMEIGLLNSPKENATSNKSFDPYAEMGTSVQIAEKKKEIAQEHDPYEDLGTVSTRSNIEKINNKINKHNIVLRKSILPKNEYTPKTRDST